MLKSEVTLENAQDLGLSLEEFQKINEILGRIPNYNELIIFAALWSDIVSYKNSILWLRTLPFSGKSINVGLISNSNMYMDLENGYSALMKIHNQGTSKQTELHNYAAIAVANANQGVFTSGAKPVAQLHSLRLGNMDSEEVQIDLTNIIKGIAEYEHALEVPMAGDDVSFDEAYKQSPLINIMSVGVQKNDNIGKMPAIGSKVFVFGAFTKKEGNTVSCNGNRKEARKVAMPSYDPYLGKLLLDATLEILETGAIVGMQAICTGGISAAAAYLAFKCDSGIQINLENIPQNKTNFDAVDLLLSETSERILIAVENDQEEAIREIFVKWFINYAEVGVLTAGNDVEFYDTEDLLAKIPLSALIAGEGTPVNELAFIEPKEDQNANTFSIHSIPEPDDLVEIANHLLRQHNIVSKKFITDKFRIYEASEIADAVVENEDGFVDILDGEQSLVFSINSNERYVKANPEKGASIALVSALRDVICVGANPLAICNSYNYGDPHNPSVYWQFVSAVKGIGKTARKFNIPVSYANVSFANKCENSVAPTPIIGLTASLNNKNKFITKAFRNKGDMIFLLGESRDDISSSEYLATYHHVSNSPIPHFDLDFEVKLNETVTGLIKGKFVRSAAPVGLGGLFITLAECGFPCDLGFDITTDVEIRNDAFLFGESQGRILVSVPSKKETAFIDFIMESGVPVLMLGHVTKGEMRIDDVSYGFISEAKKIYETTLEKKIY